MYTKVFNYKIIEERPLEALKEFKDHRRLRVFCEKGCKCVSCEREGQTLILGEGRGSQHWDVYCQDGIPMTVDHIHPRSKGGSDHLDNLQPMCAYCNFKKGNGDKLNGGYGHFCKWPRRKSVYTTDGDFEKVLRVKVGMNVWRKKGTGILENLGKVVQVVTNPHTGDLNYIVENRPNSTYSFTKTYIKKSPITF